MSSGYRRLPAFVTASTGARHRLARHGNRGIPCLCQAIDQAQFCFAADRSKRLLPVLPIIPGSDARAEATHVALHAVRPTSRSRCSSFRIGNGNFPFPEIIARTVPLVLLAKFQWATALSHDIHF